MAWTHERNYGCRIKEYVYRGLKTLDLENEIIKVTVIADQGTNITEFLHKPSDTDFMLHMYQGVRNPGLYVPTSTPPLGNFLDFYSGGWPEMFPNAGYYAELNGTTMGIHGEVALQPWNYRIERDEPEIISVRFWTRTSRIPFLLEKAMTLRRRRGVLEIDERATNESGVPLDFLWGHHPTFGEPFVSPDCVIDVPPCQVLTAEWQVDETSRLAQGYRGQWPVVKGRNGEDIDLSRLPSRDTRAHDLAFLYDMPEHWYALTNTSLQVGFGMSWSGAVFRWLWFWQQYQGAKGWPFYGMYWNMALEPASAYPPTLTDAIKANQHFTLAPGASMSAWVRAVAYTSPGRVRRITPEGDVHLA